MPRLRHLIPLVTLLASAPSLLPAAWQMDVESPASVSPDQSLIVENTQNGFTVYERSSLTRRFVVRQAETSPSLFSADGRALYFTSSDSLNRLDLSTGEITALAPFRSVELLAQDDADGALLALLAVPNSWDVSAFQLHRIDPTGRTAPTLLAEISATANKLPWLELRQIIPTGDSGRRLLVLREAGEADNEWDPRKWGDFYFVDLSLADGRLTPRSTLTSPDSDFDLSVGLRWTSPAQNLLEDTGADYRLIDPAAGKIVRELKLPKASFEPGAPGEIIAITEEQVEGETRHFHYTLASETLKTLRKVQVPDAKTRPDTPTDNADKVPTVEFPAALTPYAYVNYTFHPTKPEFFALDDQQDVHFFRLTSSGLKHQNRGGSAYRANYSTDGEAVLFEGLFDPPTEQVASANFPSLDRLVYEDPQLRNADPVYTGVHVNSPSGAWLVKINNRDATLHRFGEAPIIHSLGGAHQRDFRARLPNYAFAADESALFRLEARNSWDQAREEDVTTFHVESLAFPVVDDDPEPRWSHALPHPDFVWLDTIVGTRVRFLDVRSGELLTFDAAGGTVRTTPITGLTNGTLAPNATYSVQADASRPRVYVAADDRILTIDLSADTPRATFFQLPETVRRLHRYGDGRHLVAELGTGPLAFIDTAADALRLSLQLSIYDRDNGAYLASTPGGRFDASPEIRAEGYLLAGTRPIPLATIFDRDYQPDLLSTALGPDALAPDGELIAYVQPPAVSVETVWRNALTYYLAFNAASAQYPLVEVAIYQNEKLLRTLTGKELVGPRTGLQVELLLEQNRFKVVATNSAGVSTTSDDIILNPPEALLREKLADRRPAELHLLVVGVNEYRNPEYNLNFAVADASGVLAKLETANRELFPKINRHYLSNAQATHDGILAAFAEIQRAAQPHDAFLFYFAGHGVMSKADQQFYLIPHDVTRIYGESQSLTANGISANQLRELSATIAAQKQLFILDACNSGGALQAFAQRGASQEKAVAQLARATGTHWIAASSSTQFATEFADLGHGAFTHTLLQALDGAADTGDKRITINELKTYLEAELPAVTRRYKGAPQYPSSYGYGQDFPIALVAPSSEVKR